MSSNRAACAVVLSQNWGPREWGGRHAFVSFGFQDGAHLAVSIETRKERGEGYSTLKGFSRQHEIYYVVADERDVIRLRTNFRKAPSEEVYLYPLQVPVERIRRVFLDYMRELNALRKTPEFYNTLTTNCTTAIWLHSRVDPEHVPFSWKLLLSGYVPEYPYETGRLDTSVPFAELRRRARINERAETAGDFPGFSRRIRAGAWKPATLPHQEVRGRPDNLVAGTSGTAVHDKGADAEDAAI